MEGKKEREMIGWVILLHASVSRDHCVFEWGLTVNQNQKKDYIRKQLRKDTSSIYTKSTRFFTTCHETSALDCLRGVVLTKKNCVYQALSLSLSSTGRESERRGQGELDPNWVQPPNRHFRPTRSVPGWCTDCHF